MTDQEAVIRELQDLYEAGQPSTDQTMDDGAPHFTDTALVARMDGQAKAFHAIPLLAALVAERDALKEAAEEWEQYEREGTAEWQRIVAKHRENTAQAVAERDRYRDALERIALGIEGRRQDPRQDERDMLPLTDWQLARAALAVST